MDRRDTRMPIDNEPREKTVRELIEMGLTPRKYSVEETASSPPRSVLQSKNKTKTSLLTKEHAIKQLSQEPGLIYHIKREKDELLSGRANPQKYDPYSFLDKMAMPFNRSIPRNPGGQKNGSGSGAEGGTSGQKRTMPHCKACTDFKTWMELTANPRRNMSRHEREEKECPLDASLLGSNTWSFLHTMAAYYPEKPSAEQQHKMKKFINLLSDFYPCHKCAAHLREDLKTNIPETTSNVALSQWFCKLHNDVNVRLGKAEFDCSKVLERWRDGWADGSCD